MKTDFTLFCRTWIGIAYASGLVIGFSVTAPVLDSPKGDLVIPVYQTLTVTCRGQHTLAWTWPDQTLVAQELSDRQTQQLTTHAPRERVAVVSECEGQPVRPYCKRLVLRGARAKDTGNYRCYYKDAKSIIDGTTAVSIYAFIRDPQQPFLMRGGQSSGSDANLETILIPRFSTHVTVPCLVTIPDLNVTLHAYPAPLEKSGMTWNNKRGWTVPRHIIDVPMVIGVMCVATLNGKDYQSANFLFHITGSQVYDVKLFPEDPVELIVGEALALNCTALVEFDTGVNIKWSYPGRESNSVVNIQPYREALSHATVAFSVLTIPSVNVTNTGAYVCNVTSMDSTQTQQTQVIVHENPFINLNYRNGPVVEATAGQKSFKLQVNVSAYPTPETKWYKDGKLVNQRPEFKMKRMRMHLNHVLEIRDVCQGDAGLYTVVLKNSAAVLEQRLNITLVVNVRPQIHEKEVAEPSSPYPSGSSQTLTCTAFGIPAPSVSWQWRAWGPCVLINTNSRMVRQDRKSRSDGITDCQNWQDISSESSANQIESIETAIEVVDGRQKIVSRLHIHNASVSIMYKCTAENKVGKDERLVYFYVTTIPEGFSVNVFPSESPQEQDRVSLCCSADNYTYVHLQWYRLDPQALRDEQGKPQEYCRSVHLYADTLDGQISFQPSTNSWVLDYTIPSIQLQDEGHYVCKAQSRRNGDQQCLFRYISVKALEAPQYKHSLTNQTVNVTESLRMECDVEGRPSPRLSWFKDNQPLHQMSGIQLHDSNRTLSIQRVREEDAGLYTCMACNQRGCVHSSAAVQVVGSSDKANVEIVILIGTGVIAVFFWALLILILCNMKRVNPADIKTGYLSIIMDPGEVPLDEQCEYLPYDSSQWEIPRDRLRLGKVLGHGAFGKVMEASIYGISKSNSLNTVAVKMLKEGATASEHKALMSELKILIHIGNHLNVVNLIGACTKQNGPLMVIVEYCKYGNLSNFLRAKREFFLPYRDRSPKTQSQVRRMIEAGQMEPRVHHKSSPSSLLLNVSQNTPSCQSPAMEKMEDLWKTPLTIEDLICYSFQVARGMEFLASRKCIHRDLAARNILLSENNIVKICDFGLARDIYKDPDYVRKGNARLPLKWMAPESIFDKVYTSQSDVWSFGVLLWEIFSLGASPYPGVQIDEDFCKRLKDGVRMRAPETASPEIYGIMLACWQGEPKERPPFPALVQILGDLLQDNGLTDTKDFIPLNQSQSSEDDGFSQASSRPPSEEELRLTANILATRYYNCVPFAGCVLVGSKQSQPRVRTFDESPLEMHRQKATQDNQTDSGMVLASEEFERIEHRGVGTKSRVSSSSSTEPLTASHGSLGRSYDSARPRPNFFSQLSGQTFYNNEYGHLSEEGFCDFFSSPDVQCLASSNV